MAKAKFDIKTEATRPLYAGVGVTDLAVETVRDYVADVQTTVTTIDFEPKAFRDQTVTVVNARVDALSKEAKARRAAIEARVAELQAEARKLPTTVQTLVKDNVATATDVYAELVKRGEVLVRRIRNQESTKATVKSAKTTSAKAKTTKTQASKTAKTTAKKTSTAAKSTAKKSSAPSSAKATATAAKKTASNAATATTAAAQKVGD